MQYPSGNWIQQIHARVLMELGGESGTLHPDIVEHCVELSRMAVFGRELAATIWRKVAVLLHCLTTRHPFVDGNKRTAWAAARTLLMLNGYIIEVNATVAESMVRSVAEGRLDSEGVARWIQKYSLER